VPQNIFTLSARRAAFGPLHAYSNSMYVTFHWIYSAMWACVRKSLTKNNCNVFHDVRIVALKARQLLYEGVVSRVESDHNRFRKHTNTRRSKWHRSSILISNSPRRPWDEKGSELHMCALQFKRARLREPYIHMLANLRPLGIEVEPYSQRELVLRH
jgi:hypothetical protein